MDKYLKLFIDEAYEYLEKMDKCMIELEKNPDGENNLFQLYRCAHSIKGMAATMGYSGIADLSHSMEDLFDMLYKKKVVFNKDLIAVLYEGIDYIRQSIENIKEGKEELVFHDYLRNLKNLLREEKKAIEKINEINISRRSITEGDKIVDDLKEEAINFLIEINLLSDSPFPAARAMVIYNKLNAMGKIKKFDPPMDEITKGRPCYSLKVEYNAALNKEEIENLIKSISEVEKINITEVKTEAIVKDAKSSFQADEHDVSATFKIESHVLDSIYNIVSELYILNEEFQEYKNQLTPDLIKISTDYNFLIRKLYDDISKVRLLPLNTIMGSLPRIVREIAKDENKKVKYIVKGDEVLVDKSILEHLIDPFIHLVRNAVDHGIERPEERIKFNKKEEGLISIDITTEMGYLKVVFMDDGKGINLEKIKEVAIKKGFLTLQKAEQMSDEEILSLITLPGFSTAPSVSEISGRGFGMDIVKARIESIGGRIKIESKLNKGTKFLLYIPLEISIIDSFIITSSDKYFAIPMTYIIKTDLISKQDIQYVQSEAFSIIDNKKVQLIFLGDLLNFSVDNARTEYYAMMVETGYINRAILVDEIIEQKRVIVKPLKSPLELLTYYQGIAILGKGKLLPVIDVNKLISY